MSYKYWAANLNNDKGQYAKDGQELDRVVREMLDAGVASEDIGISLEDEDA